MQKFFAVCAAAATSEAELRQVLETADVNAQNMGGDTALHLAYYTGRESAIARLRKCGADDTLRNGLGLTPTEMAEVSRVERLLEKTLTCLTGSMWIDEQRGHRLYTMLRQCEPRIYNPALARVFQRDRHPYRLVCLAVMVGIAGSEAQLGKILHGKDLESGKRLATIFLHSGSSELADYGTRWAHANGYKVVFRPSGTSARWGRY
ncbi:hypothetical protein [Streptomyces sp. MAR4 CNX-425]|uniref:hypothetical protein n=1 Tax=Streptomyces sp. MAR4 CNX-425 TaxID=3406343 RepID=UPI003B505B79